MKPILKWAGGKRQLLDEIDKRLPEKFNNYYEPFVGGGSVFIHLQFSGMTVNDINSELINVYTQIKNNPTRLIKKLKEHKNEEEYYYEIRNKDKDKKKFNKMSKLDKASRFIYLNRTCFNGLYRENSNGEFNVPFGKYKNPIICDEETIRSLSKMFKEKNVTFLNEDYLEIIKMAGKDDFVYLDPPYDVVNATSFTKYSKNDFSRDDQKKLKEALDELDKRGGKFLLSNAKTDFIEDLYKDYTIDIVEASRNINSDASGRGKVEEVMVRNY